jgi:hypothetical protein
MYHLIWNRLWQQAAGLRLAAALNLHRRFVFLTLLTTCYSRCWNWLFFSCHECLTAGERVTENIWKLYQIRLSYIEIGLFKVCVSRYSQNPFEHTDSCCLNFLGCCPASIFGVWPTFRDHLFVPSSGSYVKTFLPKTLNMGQTSDPETLAIHQKLTPGKNPKILSNITTTAESFNYIYGFML